MVNTVKKVLDLAKQPITDACKTVFFLNQKIEEATGD